MAAKLEYLTRRHCFARSLFKDQFARGHTSDHAFGQYKPVLQPQPFLVPSPDTCLDRVIAQRRDLLFKQRQNTGIVSENVVIGFHHHTRQYNVKQMDPTEIEVLVVDSLKMQMSIVLRCADRVLFTVVLYTYVLLHEFNTDI